MIFYDTCSLLNGYTDIFKNIKDEPFAISNLTLSEIETIKVSKTKDNEIKYKAKKVSRLLNYYYGQYTIVNYEKDWDSIYLEPNPILLDNTDSRIVISAFVYSETNPVVFITHDINCNNIARSIGLTTNMLSDKTVESYTGYFVKSCITDDDVSELYTRIFENDDMGLLNNQYLVIQQNNKFIDCFVLREGKYEQVQFDMLVSNMFGEVKPLDVFQRAAIDALRNNHLIMLRGKAGAGKSYLSLGYLFECLERNKIDKIIIFCNTVATKDSAKLGYYPGSRTEKLLDSQIGNFLSAKLGDRTQVERMIHEGTLVLLPMSDIRGFDTTGMRAGIYVTEAQNLTVDLMKLALQRIGEDAICILDGDSNAQVDLDTYAGNNNGMRKVSEVFRGQDFYAEITLPICHRSRIAEIADKM